MIPLKPFQTEAVDSAVELFIETSRMLKNTKNFNEQKLIVSHNGCLLIEAPTGAGKTLMAGHVVERVSKKSKTVWFWIAPFSGLVGQAMNTIRSEFSCLQVRDPKNDRLLAQTKSGDVFVLTWSSVAVNNANLRKVRSDTEQMPSLDFFVEALRSAGYTIGVVIDEAHHGFQKAREALTFYRDILAPEFTILITATPNDQDIQRFKTSAGIAELHKISVSREDCVDTGLVKRGLKAIAFLADESTKNITDYERTALRYGVEIQNKIAQALEENDIQLTPLMLIQVDSRPNSVEEAKKNLIELGIGEDHIAIHTADEPDPNVLAIAHDENVHALVFKMAVALGFDAPRAFTLVSLRKVRDADFGVQVVGRILRVHRKLQGKELPDVLNFGYSVLADYSSQEGLSVAAERVNKIKSDISGVTPSYRIAFIPLGEDNPSVQVLDHNQMPSLFPEKSQTPKTITQVGNASTTGQSLIAGATQQQSLWDWVTPVGSNINLTKEIKHQVEGNYQPATVIQEGFWDYDLRHDIYFPTAFIKERYPLEATEDILNLAVSNFRLDPNILAATLRETVSVTKRELDVFAQDQTPVTDQAYADISDKAISKMVQLVLFENNYVDGRQLYSMLIGRLRQEFRHLGWSQLDSDENARKGLDRIIAAYPSLIQESLKQSLYNFVECVDGITLPDKLSSENPLPSSKLNLYKVFPRKLNNWEKNFANLLDNDISGTILWWHRNGDSGNEKAYSVSCAVPGRNDFYPDFVVGVKGRPTLNNVILIEVKEAINREDSVYKARVEHKSYRRVMMVTKKDNDEWWIVTNDSTGKSNRLDRPFRIDSLMGW